MSENDFVSYINDWTEDKFTKKEAEVMRQDLILFEKETGKHAVNKIGDQTGQFWNWHQRNANVVETRKFQEIKKIVI